ncbi:MAG: DNA polymerase III subunit beta [Candidatus Pacebacteria bacterium]|nr:DNA polymerase III subunit beta [Candidatus Paceibacterota bacterium]MBP9818411.1 DNA polymerase III subunit beta [Candidatus Paceibacterota bacterium]
MKLETIRERLVDAIQKAEKVTSKNATLPVLKCVLLEAKDNSLLIRSTNLDIGLEIKIPVKVQEEGSTAIPGNILSNFISQLGGEKSITLESKDGTLSVNSSKNSTTIKSFATDDYPTIPKVNEDTSKSFKISATSLISGLKAVWYSSATSTIKPELSSVRMYPLDGNLVFVATDGFRLAEKQIPAKNLPDFVHVLIPVRNAAEIIRIFDGIDEEITVFIDDNQIAVVSSDIYLISRTIEGNFPDYKAIIPKEFVTEAVILKQDLSNALKISTIFSDAFFHVKFLVNPGEKKLQITTKNNEIGESSTSIVATLSGQDIDINFNYRYINDAMVTLNSDSLSFSFSGSNKPLVIKSVGDSSFTYLVMPMNR